MPEITERLSSLRALIDAEELRSFAHAENELTRFLWDFRDDSQKTAALEKLKARLLEWPKNDLSRFLLLRVDNKLRHLAERASRARQEMTRAA